MKTVKVLAIVLAVFTSPAFAQGDFRALDRGRPVRTEDAYPIKYGEWEWEVGTEVTLADEGEYEAALALELKVGIASNWEFGIDLHPVWVRELGNSQAGIEAFGAHLLFNLNQEGRSMPAFAARVDVTGPGAGDVAREDVAAHLTGIFTKSFARTSVHLNGGYGWASIADGGEFWTGGLALSRPLGLSSRALMGDVYAEFPAGGGEVRIWVEFGTRMQLTKVTVLDLGLSSRVDRWADGAPNIGLVVGLSRMFGIPGLVRVPPYPNPRIN